jgi:endonuclease/exonuclease/phosphatase family metal-dependent hydrolase
VQRTITRRGFLALTGASTIGAGIAGRASAKPNKDTFATYNVTDLRTEQVQSPGNEQAAAAARVIQETRPDVLVLNELTNNRQESAVRDVPTDQTNARAFAENYLSVPQYRGLHGLEYPYIHVPKSNTGVHSGLDLDNNDTIDDTPGDRTYGNDAYGFGVYPGQYALAILSRYPIQEDAIRSFRTFLWADMPDSLLPRDPSTEMYLTDAEAEQFRLSSKTHVDVPIAVNGDTVHALAAHPTPPVFDGAGNFNGKRCHDEIRLFADYVAGADYLYDDSGMRGGLDNSASYVLMGDMNAAPGDAESLNAATEFFVKNDDFTTRRFPTSPGGAQQDGARSRYWTATFESQVDYVLPSPDLGLRRSAVVWPGKNANKRGLGDDVRTASDHRLVRADIATGR